LNPQAATGAGPIIALMAAGESRRFGGIKQLAAIHGQPMCRYLALRLLSLSCPLVVVTGAHAGAVEQSLIDLPLQIVRNDDWPRGLGSSIARAARHVLEVHAHATGLLVCLADQPLTAPGHLQRMLARHREHAHSIIATGHDGRTGPPVLFPRDMLAELATWQDARGAHALLERESGRVEALDAPESPDVDTREDLMRAVSLLDDARHGRFLP